MSRTLFFIFSFFACLGIASAQTVYEVDPVLVANETRDYLHVNKESQAEQTVLIEQPAQQLVIEYSSDGPIEMRVSFPFDEENGDVGMNPLHVLRVPDLPATRATISVDLTASPAWSPRSDVFILHVRGDPGVNVAIHSIEHREPTFFGSVVAGFRQLMIDEPVLLSSINFLWGYHALGFSLSVLFGLLLLCVVIGSQVRIFNHQLSIFNCFFATGLIILVLYDARFSFDLLKLTATDLHQWRTEREYRHLGPIYQIADRLKQERVQFEHQAEPRQSMKVAMCYDGADFLQKQLRYIMYPTPVQNVHEEWDAATHLVFIDTQRGEFADGIASCGQDFFKEAKLLHTYPYDSSVLRLSL